MGKLAVFNIVFENASGVFFPGSIIQGHVNIELSAPMNMRGIRLSFEGKAYVRWKERENINTVKHRQTHGNMVYYNALERYFDQDVLLYGILPGQGNHTTELPIGQHTLPFQFQLPQGLPSSFEGGIGHVRYLAKAVIDKPWKFDHKTKRAFTVLSILDLNMQPAYMNRMQGNNQKNLCCLCCQSGPITASFCIERQGYVPGEVIKLFAEISNGTSRRIDMSYVDLKMVTTFHAHAKSKSTSIELARVTRPGIEGHSEDSWDGEQLVIPPLPPSCLVGCRLIDIRYILKLSVVPTGLSMCLEVPLEIIIGTIPLASVVDQFPPKQPSASLDFDGIFPEPSAPSADAMAIYPSAPSSGIPNLPPPSYAECVTGKVDIREEGDNEHTRGDLDYTPVYTYYNWGHQPGPLPPQSGQINEQK